MLHEKVPITMTGLFLILFLNNFSKSAFGEYNEKDFITYTGKKMKVTSDVKHLSCVSVIECRSSCFSSGKCCAISYSPVTNACLIDENDMCCPETEDDINWNISVKNGFSTIDRPIDCQDIQCGSGVYTIYGVSQNGLQVLCDMDTDGGGWTVFQRRTNGDIDFYQEWSKYENGFGDLRKEFWIGNKYLHKMTSQHSYVLRIELEDFENETRYAQYGTFSIGDSNDKYRITIGAYSGNAGDSMFISNGMNFTTKDQDNDQSENEQCAQQYKGAWWYCHCHKANLNGQYLGGHHDSYADGIEWLAWKGDHYSLKSVKMMIRRT